MFGGMYGIGLKIVTGRGLRLRLIGTMKFKSGVNDSLMVQNAGQKYHEAGRTLFV